MRIIAYHVRKSSDQNLRTILRTSNLDHVSCKNRGYWPDPKTPLPNPCGHEDGRGALRNTKHVPSGLFPPLLAPFLGEKVRQISLSWSTHGQEPAARALFGGKCTAIFALPVYKWSVIPIFRVRGITTHNFCKDGRYLVIPVYQIGSAGKPELPNNGYPCKNYEW